MSKLTKENIFYELDRLIVVKSKGYALVTLDDVMAEFEAIGADYNRKEVDTVLSHVTEFYLSKQLAKDGE